MKKAIVGLLVFGSVSAFSVTNVVEVGVIKAYQVSTTIKVQDCIQNLKVKDDGKVECKVKVERLKDHYNFIDHVKNDKNYDEIEDCELKVTRKSSSLKVKSSFEMSKETMIACLNQNFQSDKISITTFFKAIKKD